MFPRTYGFSDYIANLHKTCRFKLLYSGQDSRILFVEEGNVLDVEIEDIGDQGDGLARVGPGYVVIVPDTQVGDRVTVEITEARENVAFADMVESSHSVE